MIALVVAALAPAGCWRMQTLPESGPDGDTDTDTDGDSDVDSDSDSDSDGDTDPDTDPDHYPDRPGKLTSIWGAFADDIWAGGFDGTLLHYDGEGWELVPTFSDACIRDIHGSDSYDVWVAGYGINAEQVSCPPRHMSHYDGSIWTDFTDQVWGLSPDSVVAVSPEEAYSVVSDWGVIMDPTEPPWLGTFDGVEWKFEQFGDLVGTAETDGHFSDITASWDGELLVVGHKLDHFDGTSWHEQSTSDHYWGVWARTDNDAFCAGEGGRIRRFDGSHWSLMTTPVGDDLRGVWGWSQNEVFAVGGDSIIHFDGTAWSEMAIPYVNNLQLMGVWGTGDDNVYAVGGHGAEDTYGNQLAVILRYNGFDWSVNYLALD